MADRTLAARSGRAAGIFVVLFFVAVAVLFFSRAMCCGHRDEDAYLMGARLMSHHVMFKDYLYLQPPYHATLLNAVYRLFGDGLGVCERPCYYFMARLLNWLVALGVLAVFYLLLRTMFERGLAIVGCALLAFYGGFDAASRIVRNDLLPLFFCLLALFVLFRPCETGASRKPRSFAAGFCAALAVGTKLSYIHIPAAIVLFLALWPPQLTLGNRLREQVIPFSIGAVIGFAPIALFIAADPAAFYFGVVGFHANPPPEWLAENLPGHTPLYSMWREFLTPPTTVIFVLIFLLILLVGFGRSGERPASYFYYSGQWLFFFLLVCTIFVSLLPSPSYKWYFIPIVPFLILCFASLLSYPMLRPPVRYVALAIAILAYIPNFI
ncbi:MAG TPA: glycosyltransferase family 39 protein, partial [Methyloceanibacter sp.]|nr:glycosyltransferase family 39 protein [Methyloceanibacter sp.]